MARTYSITYGAITVGGGSTTYWLEGPIRIVNKDYGRIAYVFNVIVRASSAGAFETARLALEAEFRKPYQDFQVSYGGTDDDYNHDDNTLLNTMPSCSTVPDSIFDSDVCREYECEVSGGLPADLAGDRGFSTLVTEVEQANTDARLVTFRATMTAQPGSPAKDCLEQFNENYQDEIDERLTRIDTESTVAGNWRELGLTYSEDKEKKVLEFTKVYREQWIQDGTTTPPLQDDVIRNAQITITQIEDFSQEMTESAVNRVADYVITFKTPIPIGSADAATMKSIWSTKIKPYMLQLGRSYKPESQGSEFRRGILRLIPELHPHEPSISATMLLRIDNDLIRLVMITQQFKLLNAVKLRPVLSNNPYAKVAVAVPGGAIGTVDILVEINGTPDLALQIAYEKVEEILKGFKGKKQGNQFSGQTFGFPKGAQIKLKGRNYDLLEDNSKMLVRPKVKFNAFVVQDVSFQTQGPLYYGIDEELFYSVASLSVSVEFYQKQEFPKSGYEGTFKTVTD